MRQFCVYRRDKQYRCLEFDIQHSGYQWDPVGEPEEVTERWPQLSLELSEVAGLLNHDPDPDLPLQGCPVLEGWKPVSRDWVLPQHRGMTPEEFKRWKEETGYDD
jgi:hypothetical protein